MGTLIQGGTVITALDRQRADVYCQDDKIAAVGPDLGHLAGPTDEVVDADGAYVFPGGVDPHTHFEFPFMGTVSADDFFDGTASAMAGGTTSVLDFVVPTRGEPLLDAAARWHEKAAKSVGDYGFHMALVEARDDVFADIPRVVHEAHIPSFKAFMAYKGTVGVDDEVLVRFLKTVTAAGGVLWLHAENGDAIADRQRDLLAQGKTHPRWHARSRPPELEAEAVHRALVLADLVHAPVGVVHMSSADAYRAFAEARVRGQEAFAETCPQYLVLDDSVYDQPDFEGAAYVMSPPIRPAGHSDWLWKGLANGLIRTVGTDHCPFRQADQKVLGRDDFTKIPNGGPGVENRLELLWHFGVAQGRFDAHRFVEVTSTNVAKQYGLYPRKGAVRVGADADLVVLDPRAPKTLSTATDHSRCDRSLYEGVEVSGSVRHVVAQGQVRFTEGDLRVERGAGRFLPRDGRRPA